MVQKIEEIWINPSIQSNDFFPITIKISDIQVQKLAQLKEVFSDLQNTIENSGFMDMDINNKTMLAKIKDIQDIAAKLLKIKKNFNDEFIGNMSEDGLEVSNEIEKFLTKMCRQQKVEISKILP